MAARDAVFFHFKNAETMKDEIIINEVKFVCPQEDGQIFVPIKPLCEALGIDNKNQQDTIKNHPIWGSTVVLKTTVGGDEKQREMLCIPLKYTFGWLMGIDARSVKPEAYDSVIRYQEAAYDALYDRFFLEPAMQKRKLMLLLEKENAILQAELQKKELNARIKEMKKELEEIKVAEPKQLAMFAGQ